MDSSNQIFDDLSRAGPILHGIIRPDPANADRISIASPGDLSQWASIPVGAVRDVAKAGTVHGLPNDYHLVNVTMTSEFSPDPELRDKLAKLTSSDLATAVVPVFCYDQVTHRQVPCP